MDGNKPPTPAELTILIAGAVMLVASFFDFAGNTNAWGTYLVPRRDPPPASTGC